MRQSVAPRFQQNSRGPNPMENTSTRTPHMRATIKCPHSCTRMMMPKTSATPIKISNAIVRATFFERRPPMRSPSILIDRNCHHFSDHTAYFFLCDSARFRVNGQHVVHLLDANPRGPG